MFGDLRSPHDIAELAQVLAVILHRRPCHCAVIRTKLLTSRYSASGVRHLFSAPVATALGLSADRAYCARFDSSTRLAFRIAPLGSRMPGRYDAWRIFGLPLFTTVPVGDPPLSGIVIFAVDAVQMITLPPGLTYANFDSDDLCVTALLIRSPLRAANRAHRRQSYQVPPSARCQIPGKTARKPVSGDFWR